MHSTPRTGHADQTKHFDVSGFRSTSLIDALKANKGLNAIQKPPFRLKDGGEARRVVFSGEA